MMVARSIGIVLLALLAPACGFSVNHHPIGTRHIITYPASNTALCSSDNKGKEDDVHSLFDNKGDTPSIDRRKWIQIAASSAVIFGGSNAGAANAEEGTDDTNTKVVSQKVGNKSVIVLGANGGTGRECVSTILASGRQCIATSRSGRFNYDEDDGSDAAKSSLLLPSNTNIQQGKADVTNLESLLTLVDQSSNVGAMIFAASCTLKGNDKSSNDALAVDYQGVINAAQCCIQRNIPRLVIVSSGAVTRPDSAVYKLLNFVGGGIMAAKIQGEDKVRDLYHDKDVMNRGLGYTVVRPGGLTTEPPKGPAFLEVNQGDDKSGRLSRADVAGICVASLDIESAFDATFECYELNTAKPVNNVGLSNLLKQTDTTSYTSGREGRGDTWDGLLGGLKSDFVV